MAFSLPILFYNYKFIYFFATSLLILTPGNAHQWPVHGEIRDVVTAQALRSLDESVCYWTSCQLFVSDGQTSETLKHTELKC